MNNLPTVSIVIPTYNSERTLKSCLKSIAEQDYPKDKLELIIADAGSTDKTLEISKQYTKNILKNPLKTGEAGKAIGVKRAKNEIIALIDSDNILPQKDWLKTMVEPFQNPEITGTEPIEYTYRKEDDYITRYCALMGMNDPLCFFLENYDRMNLISKKWTGLNIAQEDKGNYLKIRLNEQQLPTIGANGFLVRRALLKKCSIDDYLFDIDIVYELIKQGHNRFAKVKIGIIHIFSGNISTFTRKTRRRIKDHAYYKKLGLRKYPWNSLSKLKLLKFILYTVLIVPLLVQSTRGWLRKRDDAWYFHVNACWITLQIYAFEIMKNGLFGTKIENRHNWNK